MSGKPQSPVVVSSPPRVVTGIRSTVAGAADVTHKNQTQQHLLSYFQASQQQAKDSVGIRTKTNTPGSCCKESVV